MRSTPAQHTEQAEFTAQKFARSPLNKPVDLDAAVIPATIEIERSNSLADLAHRIHAEHVAVSDALTDSVRHAITAGELLLEAKDKLLIQRCIAEGVGVIHDPGYSPLAGRSEEEEREWHLFILFLSEGAGEPGCFADPDRIADHVEWILQRPFQNVAEWLGEEGDKFRKRWGMGMHVSDNVKQAWASFHVEQQAKSLPDIIAMLQELKRQFPARAAAAKIIKPRRRKASNAGARS